MPDQTKISRRAAEFRELIEDGSRFLSTCDGGDPGTPDAPSIWLMGLEPGWSAQDDANDITNDDLHRERLEAYPVELQLTWPFNRTAFKLLAALNGEAPEDYVNFARRERPFERGVKGHFKLNLFAAPCNKLGEWTAEHAAETGFDNKTDYQTWMREARFPILRAWIEKSRPKLIICTGVTHLADFLAVTQTAEPPPPNFFTVNGHKKRLHVTTAGLAPIAVIPHLSGGVHGLNSHEAIAKAATLINEALANAKR